MTPHDDDAAAARDPHLLAALRHAPDRDAQPPPEVTARILAAARAAVRPAAPPSWAQRFAAWWRQPPLGAAFGTLMAALLVGVLWSTREPLPNGQAPSATAPAPAPFEAAAPSGEAPPVRAVERDAGLAASRDRPTTADASREAGAAPPTRSVPAAKNEAPRRPAEQAPEAKARVEQRAAPRRSDAAQPQPAPAAAPSADAMSRPAPPAAPAAAAVPQPEPAAAAPPPAESMRQQQAADARAANDAKALRGRAADPPGARFERREGADAAPSMPSALGRLTQADSAAADPLARIDIALAAPDIALRASWRSDDGIPRAVAHGASQHAWWRELRAGTQGRWQRVPASPPAPPWLTLTIDGFDRRWWLDGEHVVMADADGGSAWRVPVTEAQRRAWSQAIAGW